MIAHIEGLLILLRQRLLPGLPIQPHVGHRAGQTCDRAATELRVCQEYLLAKSAFFIAVDTTEDSSQPLLHAA